MSTCRFSPNARHASQWGPILLAFMVACLLPLSLLTGCAGMPSAGDATTEASGAEEELPFIQARYGYPGATNAIVVDGTIELVTIEEEAAPTDGPAGESAGAAVADDAANDDAGDGAENGQATTYYVLRLDRQTTFSMLYDSEDYPEQQATTDAVLLYAGSHGDGFAVQGTDAGDQLWGSLVGAHLSVRGELWVSGNGAVGLEYPLAADAGRLAQQVGVPLNTLGMKGAEAYGKEGYSWKQLAQIAQVISLTQNRDYGIRMANAYGLLTDQEDVKTFEMGDSSCTVRLVDVMADVTTGDDGKDRYVGMTFMCLDTPCEHAFDTPAEDANDLEDAEDADGLEDSTRVSWSGSQMAEWLDKDVYDALPGDLQQLVTPVNKACTVVDGVSTVPTIEVSTHLLWVPSVTELGGAPEWSYPNTWLNAEDYAACNEILAQEESKSRENNSSKKYLYFYRNEVSSDDYANKALVLTDPETGLGYSWWTRTIDPSGYPHYVSIEGSLRNANVGVETSQRVVFGFCLG